MLSTKSLIQIFMKLYNIFNQESSLLQPITVSFDVETIFL